MEIGEKGTCFTVERGAFKGGSALLVTIFSVMGLASLIILIETLREGDLNLDALLLPGFFSLFFVALLVLEVQDSLPARLVVTHDAAKYYVGGRLKESIALGSEVKADVKLDSSRIGPQPKAFHSTCAEDASGPPEPGFLLMCGISLTRGRRSISISHDDGWRLADFSELWDPFFDLVMDHDMEMGSNLWRYVQFRDTLQARGDGPGLGMFDMIREIPH